MAAFALSAARLTEMAHKESETLAAELEQHLSDWIAPPAVGTKSVSLTVERWDEWEQLRSRLVAQFQGAVADLCKQCGYLTESEQLQYKSECWRAKSARYCYFVRRVWVQDKELEKYENILL